MLPPRIPTCSEGLQSERWLLSRWAAASPMGLKEAGLCSTSWPTCWRWGLLVDGCACTGSGMWGATGACSKQVAFPGYQDGQRMQCPASGACSG